MEVRTKYIAGLIEIDIDALPELDLVNPWQGPTRWAYEIAMKYEDRWIPTRHTLCGGETGWSEPLEDAASGILYACVKILNGTYEEFG